VRCLPPTNSFLLLFFCVCANFGEIREEMGAVCADGRMQMDTRTEANWFYNLSHAICYSYGTDDYRLEEPIL